MSDLDKNRLRWALPFAVWTLPVLGTFFYAWHEARLAGHRLTVELWRPLAVAPFCYVWAALTPGIFALRRRLSAAQTPVFWAATVHAGAAVVAWALEALVATASLRAFAPESEQFAGPGTLVAQTVALFRGSSLLMLPLYGITALVGYAIDLYRLSRERETRAATLAAQLAQAQLGALRMQLNPHFLFNSLNAVAGLVRDQQNRGAVHVLAQLSDLLRHVLDGSGEHEVPLRAELDFIDRYLELERVRFPDRLKVEVDAADDALEALVPNLVLQPLVENAIRHGIGRRTAAGCLRIAAHRRGDTLELIVQDDGPGLQTASPHRAGVGLANTAARLQQLYGSRATLTVRDAPEGGVVATVLMPFRLTPQVPSAPRARSSA